jgi:hypothetical protein
VLLRLLDGNGRAQFVPGAHEKPRLQLKVQELRGPKHWRLIVVEAGLPAGPTHTVPARKDGTGPAVVAHRQVHPVVLQGVLRAPKHRTDVGGMLLRRVEVRVVAHVDGQVKRNVAARVQGPLAERGVVSKRFRIGPEKRLDPLPDGSPRLRPQPHDLVQGGLRKGTGAVQAEGVEVPLFIKQGKVEHVVADGNPHPGHRRVRGREDAVREILNGKRVRRSHFQKRGERGISGWT